MDNWGGGPPFPQSLDPVFATDGEPRTHDRKGRQAEIKKIGVGLNILRAEFQARLVRQRRSVIPIGEEKKQPAQRHARNVGTHAMTATAASETEARPDHGRIHPASAQVTQAFRALAFGEFVA